MTKLRRLITGLTLAAAVTTGTALATDAATPQADTWWGADDTSGTTVTPPADTTTPPDGIPITPLDTHWG